MAPRLPSWSLPLWQPRRYKVLYGGRGSAKSWTVAMLLLCQGMQQKLRIVCLREVQNSLAESSKQVLEDLARDYFPGWWHVTKERLIGRNGTTIAFRGMNAVTTKNIRSLEGVDRFWMEEAQYMSDHSAETLYPTMRKPGVELWLTFNPRYRSDRVWRDFCDDSARAAEACVLFVNFMHNPFWNDELEKERLIFLEDEPDRYAHVWLGEPDDEAAVRKVIPYATAQACVEAWDKWAPANGYTATGRLHAGLDIADTGADFNALVARRGPLVQHVERWTGKRVTVRGDEDAEELKSRFMETARRADRWCRDEGVARLYYDVGGLGAPMRSILTEIAKTQGRRYRRNGVLFGGKVEGEDVLFNRQETNADYFHRRKDQLGWALHLRAQRTLRLLDGDKVDPDHCLFIDRNGIRLTGRDGTSGLGRYLNQLSQPEWEENSSGKIVIEKQPKIAEGSTAKMKSPDAYDATVLAFAVDSRSGLKARAA